MSRAILALVVAGLCLMAAGCFSAKLDPGVRVRTPKARVRMK